jgi:hypothetical protein
MGLGAKKTEKTAKKTRKLVDILHAGGNLALLQHFNPELL